MRATRSRNPQLVEVDLDSIKQEPKIKSSTKASKSVRNTSDAENALSPSKKPSPPKVVRKREPVEIHCSPLRPKNSPSKIPSSLTSSALNKSHAKQKLSFDSDVSVSLAEIETDACAKIRVSNASRRLTLGTPDELVCRDKERRVIREFVDKCVDERTPASLYISGPPGTGKTACIRQTLTEYQDREVTEVYINCMSVANAAAVTKQFYNAVAKKPVAKVDPEQLNKLLVAKTGNMILLVLDEIDQLETRTQDVLYTAFGWCALINSRVILIGIANSLDLTQRSLPKLKVQLKVQPQLLHFKPYSSTEVVAILEHRLSQTENVLRPQAMELLARKVSSKTGDIRTALQMCDKVLQKYSNKEPVGVKEVLVAAQDNNFRKVSLPLQQKLVLASLVAVGSTTVNQLYTAYGRGCSASRVPQVQWGEWRELLTLLQSQGLVTVMDTPRKSTGPTVRLYVQKSAAIDALEGHTLVQSVLDALKK